MATPPHGTPPPSSGEAPVRHLAPGTVVADRYRVEELLGEGGMGAVYRAEHVHMRKQVAVKVLHPSMLATDEIVTRFEREAVAAGNIAHPNVAAATDFGKLADGSFFLVLEYIDGRSLRALLNAEGQLSADRALGIVQQISAALGAAHAKGVVHRDLKPENVMLVARPGEEELVKVLDFGIAKMDIDSVGATSSGPASSQPLTRIGAVFGTPDYMSPEQAVGQAVDGRADLYSIGVMLYEMLAGERPYRGGTVTVMRQHVLGDIPDLPSRVLATVDGRIGPLVKALLAKTPDARVSSAQELHDRVAQLRADPGPPAPVVPAAPSSRGAGTLATSVAAFGAAASAPTAMAIEGSPAPGLVVSESGAPGPSTRGALPPWVVAAVGGGALLLGLGLVVAWFALRSPSPAHTAATAPSASTGVGADVVDPGVALPPPPNPNARSEAPGSTQVALGVAPAAESTDPPASERPPTKGGAPSSRPPHASGHPKEKEGRKTGPGGIYIPPPKDWFN